MSAFAPLGDSSRVTISDAASVRTAIGSLPANGVLRIIPLNPNQTAFYIKLGDNTVVAARNDSMKVDQASLEAPIIVPVYNSQTHIAILAEGGSGDVLITRGAEIGGNFAPLGAGSQSAITETDQTIALPTLGTRSPAIRVHALSGNMSALWVKLGNGSVTGSTTTSMKIQPGSKEDPTIIGRTASETHISIFCEGQPGNVQIMGGDARNENGASNADTLDGFDTSSSGNRWGVIPVVASDGVMEIGRVLDFHNSDGDTGDFSIRVRSDDIGNGTDLSLLPTAGGDSGVLKRIVAVRNATLAQGDVFYYDGANIVRLAPGTSGQVLKTNGAGANPAWANAGVTPVAQGAVSSAATLDLALGSADMYEIDLMNIVPVTDNVTFNCRLSQSGSFLSGANNYQYSHQINGAASASAGATQMVLTTSVGNNTNERLNFTLRIFRPSVGSFIKQLHWIGGGRLQNAAVFNIQGFGELIANSNAVDGIQFFMSSGNISSLYYASRSFSFS
jgi:hypothetical protein